jgi:hypothetical protein
MSICSAKSTSWWPTGGYTVMFGDIARQTARLDTCRPAAVDLYVIHHAYDGDGCVAVRLVLERFRLAADDTTRYTEGRCEQHRDNANRGHVHAPTVSRNRDPDATFGSAGWGARDAGVANVAAASTVATWGMVCCRPLRSARCTPNWRHGCAAAPPHRPTDRQLALPW